MADDWGCNVDLFGETSSAVKPTAKSLTELVDSLTKKKNHPPTTVREAENVKVVSLPTKIKMVHAPKILKKKKANGHHGNDKNHVKVLNEANPKRVHFDIEQFLSREAAKGDRVKARGRMLAGLGAAPAKRDYVNYKDLKADRAAKKAEAKAHAESASRSVSKSPDYRRDRSNSRSRSARGRFGGGGGGGRHGGGGGGAGAHRENPPPSRCLGVFNLSSYTTEKDLRDVFGEFGDIDKCELVYDRPSGHSRGFGFIYYKNMDDATAARDKLCNTDLDGHKIRVDYSFTKRGHSPTPGQYMGERRGGGFGGGGDRHYDSRGSGRGDRYGGGGRRSPDGRRSNYGGGGGGDRGYRSGGNGYGDRNGGGGDRRDFRDRRDNNGGSSSGGHRPYDPSFRRRVASYASGGNGGGSGGRRRSSERH